MDPHLTRLALCVLLLIASPAAADAPSGAGSTMRANDALRAALAAKWPEWSFAPIAPSVAEWATQERIDPTAAYGDFDADDRTDAAFLVLLAPGRKQPSLAVRHSRDGRLVILDELRCYDGLLRRRKGQGYYDHETQKTGTYARDGIHVFCFQKAGQTWVLDRGVYRMIVDSD